MTVGIVFDCSARSKAECTLLFNSGGKTIWMTRSPTRNVSPFKLLVFISSKNAAMAERMRSDTHADGEVLSNGSG